MFHDAKPFDDPNEVHREIIVIRQATETKEPIKIVVSQVITPAGDLALCTIHLSGELPRHLEKPDLMEDIAIGLIRAAGYARKWNKAVRNDAR